MISLSESLRPNLRSKYILRPKLSWTGLSPDFSVQLKVSLSESLSERLSQKLVTHCLWYYRRNEQCELILVSEASLQQDRFILLSSSNVSQFLTPWLFLNSSLKFISPENNSTVAQSRTLREIIFFTRLRIALHRKEWQCNLLYSVFVCCFFSLQSTLYDYRQLPFFAYCVPVLCTST